MRFLSVNNLQLGRSPGGIPAHIATDSRPFSTRIVWQRAVTLAVQEGVHAVLLSGQTLSPANTGPEPWGPLTDGLAELQQAGIPVIAVEHAQFTPHNLAQFTNSEAVHWLDDSLDWEPIFTTSMVTSDEPTVHVIDGTLAESSDAPVENPVTLEQVDHPESIWLLTASHHADAVEAE